jgi:hypothetical protein
MSSSSFRIAVGLEAPRTAEETIRANTPDGMRAAIFKGSHESPLIRTCLQKAQYAGLSGEDTYVLLAYQALIALESYAQRCLEISRRHPDVPPIFVQNPAQG